MASNVRDESTIEFVLPPEEAVCYALHPWNESPFNGLELQLYIGRSIFF